MGLLARWTFLCGDVPFENRGIDMEAYELPRVVFFLEGCSNGSFSFGEIRSVGYIHIGFQISMLSCKASQNLFFEFSKPKINRVGHGYKLLFGHHILEISGGLGGISLIRLTFLDRNQHRVNIGQDSRIDVVEAKKRAAANGDKEQSQYAQKTNKKTVHLVGRHASLECRLCLRVIGYQFLPQL